MPDHPQLEASRSNARPKSTPVALHAGPHVVPRDDRIQTTQTDLRHRDAPRDDQKVNLGANGQSQRGEASQHCRPP